MVHPALAKETIREGVAKVLKQDLSSYLVALPKHFIVDIHTKDIKKAQKASFYPGIKKISSSLLRYETDDDYEVLRMIMFVE